MFNNHRVIVTMTSWTKRIQNCHPIIQALLDNSVKPDFVFLNLSIEEFPKRNAQIPRELVDISIHDPRFKINWVTGPNSKSMKKVFPILPFIDDDDYIIIVDDDIEIPNDLIHLRLKEFNQHEGRFAISGGSHPKWHLNKILYDGITYNTIIPTSIFTKRMLKGYDQIMSRELVNTYHDDFIYSLLILSNGYWILPSKKLSKGPGTSERSINVVNEIASMGKNGVYKKENVVFPIWESRFQQVMGDTFRNKLFNLVIFDSWDVAGDNGEYLYRGIRQQFPNVHMTFLISKDSRDYQRLKDDGFNVYPFQGEDLEFIVKNASYVLFSKDLGNHLNQRRILQKYKNKGIFLQHGVTSRIYNDDFYFKNVLCQYCRYVCCTSEEERTLLNRYSNKKLIPILCGFPRHDFLLRKIQQTKSSKTMTVLIQFHWRPFIGNEQQMRSSKFFRDIKSILNSGRIKRLVQSGVRVCFLPHPMFMRYIDCFKVPEYINVPLDRTFQDVLVDADILVTDFSSNGFEMAMMDKPTLVYVPGKQEVDTFSKRYHVNYIGQYKHLQYIESQDGLMDRIGELVNQDFTFDFAHQTYKWVDTGNCERLFKWLKKDYGS